MDLIILNQSFVSVCIVEDYVSIIWTDRYREYGDFELVLPATSSAIPFIHKNYYLYSSESEHMMIIEGIETSFSIDESLRFIITGRSLESILDRRIVWKQKTVNARLQTAVQTLLNESFINPSITSRKVSNFTFATSSDSYISSQQLRAQYTGDNIYDIITNLCLVYDIGFRIFLTSANKFQFSFYKGKDRSYNQDSLPYVVFSPHFDNLVNADYYETDTNLKTITLVGGEDQGNDRRYQTTAASSASGLNRRELFTDARDISSIIEDGVMPAAEYLELLVQRGKEKLAECKVEKAFSGETELSIMYEYGVDFFLGDTVQISDGYGHESPALITEIIFSEDAEGHKTYPTFEVLNNDE